MGTKEMKEKEINMKSVKVAEHIIEGKKNERKKERKIKNYQ